MSVHTRARSWAAAIIGGSLGVQAALAQTTPPAQSAPDANAPVELAEVVVTAEKRVSSEQKTAISMSVISAADIAQKGIVDLQTLSANDTSINFSAGGSEGGYLTVRGVSSHDVTEIGDPAVPVVVDGFTMIRPYTLTTSLYDLERIEVLRGPQGTLYGRNAIGGLVNVITKRPEKELSVGARVELGNYSTQNATAFLNVPLNDLFQIRISGSWRKHDGYRNNVASNGFPATRGDDEDSRSVRAQLAFTPSEAFQGLLTFQATQIGGVGPVSKYLPFVTNPDLAGHPNDIDHRKPAIGSFRTFPLYGPPYSQSIDDKVTKLQLTYSGLPDGISLTYLGGYSNLQYHHVSVSPTIFSFLGYDLATPSAGYQNEFPKTLNQELRIASDSSGPFVWQTGVYYFEERSTNLRNSAVVNPYAANETTLFLFTFPLVQTRSRAVFGQASYALNSTSKITAGARYSKDDKTREGSYDIPLFGFFGVTDGGNASSNKITWHLGYDWSPTEQNLLYVKAGTGYKPGGFTTCNNYKPETVTAYELGSKNRLFDNRIQINVAGYYELYKDQQVGGLSITCVTGTTIQNAGRSKIYGLEAAVNALVTSADKVDLSLNLLHARFSEFVAAPTLGNPAAASCAATIPAPPFGLNCQLAGNMLTQAPNVTVAAGYDHTWRFGANGDVDFRFEGKYQSKQYFDPFNFGDTEQGGYAIVNAYITFSRANWKLSAYGRNLGDRDYLVDAAEFAGGGADVYRYGFGAPRTYGVSFEASL